MGRVGRGDQISALATPTRAREGVTRKQHFAERLNLVEQDRSTLRERYKKVSRSRARKADERFAACTTVKPGKQEILDVDVTFCAAHGGQQLAFWNAHHDERGFASMHIYHRRAARHVIDVHRCEAALVVMRIPERKLLTAMRRAERVVDVEDLLLVRLHR